MKRRISLIAVLAFIAMSTIAAGCDTLSAPSASRAPASAASGSQQSTGIWVTGEGMVSVVPDIALLVLGVEAQADTVNEANLQAAGAMDAVISALRDGGIASRDIQTRTFSITPVRRWVPEKQEEELLGYRVSNTVTARIRAIEKAGTIIDDAVRVGGDFVRVDSVSFTVEDPSPYAKEARSKAMQDAGEKASQLAAAGGVRLGVPVYINESGGFTTIPRAGTDIRSADAALSTPISPGELEVRITVQVVYDIR